VVSSSTRPKEDGSRSSGRFYAGVVSGDPEPPLLGISGKEAAKILGITELSVRRLVQQGVLHKPAKYQRFALDLAEVEQVALQRYRPGHPYWLTTTEAAKLLEVTPTRVRQLVARGFVPAVVHQDRSYFRRPQLEVIANARESRKLR